jgi:hypothetical protein
MTDQGQSTAQGQSATRPTEALLQTWIYRDTWACSEAVLLALGVPPDCEEATGVLNANIGVLECAKRAGIGSGAPKFWLWWGERSGLPFHEIWWLAIVPEGPIGYDGRHFAFSRKQMLSERYVRHERFLIGKWARKPYWTPREAIDLSLNFDPYTTNGWRGDAPETSDTIREREDRFRILERAQEIGSIAEKASALDYIRWLEQRGYYVSEGWRRAVGLAVGNEWRPSEDPPFGTKSENEDLRRQVTEQAARIVELEEKLQRRAEEIGSSADDVERLKKRIKELSDDPVSPTGKAAQSKKIAYLEKALLAAVVDGHKYDPRSAKSDVPAQVADKATELGLSLTAQTVRKYLRESADAHVDGDVWERKSPIK